MHSFTFDIPLNAQQFFLLLLAVFREESFTVDEPFSENLFMVWATIGKQCFDSGDEILNAEFMESSTSALRAITQKLQDAKAADFLKVKFFSIFYSSYYF